MASNLPRGKKTKQTEGEVGRQHQGRDRPGLRQVAEGSGETGENGGNWSQNNLLCLSDLRSKEIDEMRSPIQLVHTISALFSFWVNLIHFTNFLHSH